MRQTPKLYLLFNHTLTQQQREDAYASLSVKEIISLPHALHEIWSQIPPEAPTLKTLLLPIESYIEQHLQAGDYLLVQGDAGASFLVAQYALQRGVIPIYATTERKESTEKNIEGRVIKRSVFEHVIYRRYGV